MERWPVQGGVEEPCQDQYPDPVAQDLSHKVPAAPTGGCWAAVRFLGQGETKCVPQSV